MFWTPPATTQIRGAAHHAPARRSAPPAATSRTGDRSSRRARARGRPAASQQVRAMSPACGPSVSQQPKITSSTAAGSMPVRAIERLQHVRAEVGRVHAREPSPALADGSPHRIDDVRLCHLSSRASEEGGPGPDRQSAAEDGAAYAPEMERASPPALVERPRAPHPEVEILLPGVADRAVRLQRVARAERSGLARRELRHRDVHARAAPSRAPPTRPRA